MTASESQSASPRCPIKNFFHSGTLAEFTTTQLPRILKHERLAGTRHSDHPSWKQRAPRRSSRHGNLHAASLHAIISYAASRTTTRCPTAHRQTQTLQNSEHSHPGPGNTESLALVDNCWILTIAGLFMAAGTALDLHIVPSALCCSPSF